jgi:hypothetical protein
MRPKGERQRRQPLTGWLLLSPREKSSRWQQPADERLSLSFHSFVCLFIMVPISYLSLTVFLHFYLSLSFLWVEEKEDVNKEDIARQ